MAQRYLLSIDGGGLRAIIPLSALVKLEQVTGRLARDTFSFVAGTSTGAIVAAGIAAGISAQRLLDVYVQRGPEVFPQSPPNFIRRVTLGYMYSTHVLRDLVAEEAGPARNWVLNDSPIDLLITAKRVPDGKAWYFVKDKPANSQRTGRLSLVDCTTASAAAPTYFQPWTIPEDPAVLRQHGWEPVGTLVDGAVGVTGNPVYQAVVEALYFTDEYTPQETTVVSLGTGRFVPTAMPGNIWDWFNWVIGQLLASPDEQQTEIVQRHFRQTPFYRLDLKLPQDIAMDDVGSIALLVQLGQRFADTIDWNGILAATETAFRIGPQNRLWFDYARPQP
jgi:predicted acylesterase/phospholipase RssA